LGISIDSAAASDVIASLCTGYTPLLRHIGCVLSQTMACAIVQGVLAASGGACNAPLLCCLWYNHNDDVSVNDDECSLDILH